MAEGKATTAQLRKDMAPAASPLGTDDEAAATPASSERVEMAREAEKKIDSAVKRSGSDAIDAAHAQRGSSSPYGREEHMNEELARRKAEEADPSEQPS